MYLAPAPEFGLCLRLKVEGLEEIAELIVRHLAADGREMGTRFVDPARQGEGHGRYRHDMGMGVRAERCFDAPIGGLVEAIEPHQRHCARSEHAEQ
jgi:hypothetical protein